MRLFLAIQLPEQTKRTLEAAVLQWRSQGIQASWSRRDNYHLTLVFLGEVTQPEPVISALERVQCPPFSLHFAPCGRFRGRGGDILWLGVQPTLPLLRLQSVLQRELTEAGFSVDRRPYRPHLTLARRLRCEEPLTFPGPLPTSVPVHCFSLMRSHLSQEGARYTELYRKELMACEDC